MPTCPNCRFSWPVVRARAYKPKPKGPAPKISVYCACGAEWHGKYAIDNEVITSHVERERRGVGPCRVTVDDRRTIDASDIPRLQHRDIGIRP